MAHLVCFVIATLLLWSLHVVDAGPSPARYDQRQDGNYNVKIHLKDIKLISLGTLSSDSLNMGEYDDSNYDYEDPPEPAEKPETSTSKPPSNTTTPSPTKPESAALVSNSTHRNLTLESNLTSSTTPTPSTTPGGNSTTTSSGRPARVQPSHVIRHRTTTTPRPTPYHPYSIISTTRRPIPPIKQGVMRKMRCRPGFFRDRGGRCRKLVREKATTETVVVETS